MPLSGGNAIFIDTDGPSISDLSLEVIAHEDGYPPRPLSPEGAHPRAGALDTVVVTLDAQDWEAPPLSIVRLVPPNQSGTLGVGIEVPWVEERQRFEYVIESAEGQQGSFVVNATLIDEAGNTLTLAPTETNDPLYRALTIDATPPSPSSHRSFSAAMATRQLRRQITSCTSQRR